LRLARLSRNRIEEKLLLAGSKSLLELIHTSAGVNKLLLTGEEGMALGADINSELAALGGLGFNNFAARASDGANFVVRMDSVFHFHVPLFKNLMFFDIENHVKRDTQKYYTTTKQKLQAFLKSFLKYFYKTFNKRSPLDETKGLKTS